MSHFMAAEATIPLAAVDTGTLTSTATDAAFFTSPASPHPRQLVLITGQIWAVGTNSGGTAVLVIKCTEDGVAKVYTFTGTVSVATVGIGQPIAGSINPDANTAVTYTLTLGGTQTNGTAMRLRAYTIGLLSST